jgi:hypothetical protein
VRAFPHSPLWIKKPTASARGIGIKVINHIPKGSSKSIVQKYVRSPLLINGYKFDLRFYVLVASLDPLRIYLHENGLVRLATSEYEANIGNLKNRSAHLTNYSVNKKSKDFVPTDDLSDDGSGTKWSHEPFWPYLESIGFNVPKIRREIEDGFVTIIMAAARTFKAQRNHRVSFEMFGFDVLIDRDQKISILEVNVSPAMGTASELDKHVKAPVIRDMFNVALVPRGNAMTSKVNRLFLSDHTPSSIPHRQFASVCEYEIAMTRLGGFHCLFPTAQRCKEMKEIFDAASPNDEMLESWLYMSENAKRQYLETAYPEFVKYLATWV